MLTDNQRAQILVVLFAFPLEEPRAPCCRAGALGVMLLPCGVPAGLSEPTRCAWAHSPLSPARGLAASLPSWAMSPCATLVPHFCHELLGLCLCACCLPLYLPAVTLVLGAASPWTDQELPSVPSAAHGSHRPHPTGLGFRGQGLSHSCPDMNQKDSAPQRSHSLLVPAWFLSFIVFWGKSFKSS